jgi:hypothetical protein
LDGANYEVDSDDFNYAWPQLMAIRAALSNWFASLSSLGGNAGVATFLQLVHYLN